MKVSNSSICIQCKHFWHECRDTNQQEEYHCIETCACSDIEIKMRFDKEYEFMEFLGFIDKMGDD